MMRRDSVRSEPKRSASPPERGPRGRRAHRIAPGLHDPHTSSERGGVRWRTRRRSSSATATTTSGMNSVCSLSPIACARTTSTPRSTSTSPRHRKAGQCGAKGRSRRQVRSAGLYRDLSAAGRWRGGARQGPRCSVGGADHPPASLQLGLGQRQVHPGFVFRRLGRSHSDAGERGGPTVVDTDAGYEGLCRQVTNQPGVIKPPLGKRKALPPKQPKPEAAAAARSAEQAAMSLSAPHPQVEDVLAEPAEELGALSACLLPVDRRRRPVVVSGRAGSASRIWSIASTRSMRHVPGGISASRWIRRRWAAAASC